MQVKKDAVKKQILLSAKDDFLKNGFEKSSIRSIVKNAGTTIGNFYNYFESKDAVFEELVDEFYTNFKHFISHHHGNELRKDLVQSYDINKWREYLNKLMKPLMDMLNDRLLLLLEYGQGTKYADARQELTDVLSQHFTEHIKEYAPEYKHIHMGEIISRQIIAAIVEILKSKSDNETKQELIVEEILFCAIGVIGLLKGDIENLYENPSGS